MAYAIDIVYLSRGLLVTKIVAALPPWRCSIGFGAAMTLELPGGRARAAGFERGAALVWRSRDER